MQVYTIKELVKESFDQVFDGEGWLFNLAFIHTLVDINAKKNPPIWPLVILTIEKIRKTCPEICQRISYFYKEKTAFIDIVYYEEHLIQTHSDRIRKYLTLHKGHCCLYHFSVKYQFSKTIKTFWRADIIRKY